MTGTVTTGKQIEHWDKQIIKAQRDEIKDLRAECDRLREQNGQLSRGQEQARQDEQRAALHRNQTRYYLHAIEGPLVIIGILSFVSIMVYAR